MCFFFRLDKVLKGHFFNEMYNFNKKKLERFSSKLKLFLQSESPKILQKIALTQDSKFLLSYTCQPQCSGWILVGKVQNQQALRYVVAIYWYNFELKLCLTYKLLIFQAASKRPHCQIRVGHMRHHCQEV